MKRLMMLIIFSFFLVGCSNERELTCEKGILEQDKCKVVETMEVAQKCREGYEYNEKTKMCENTITIDAKKVSHCPDGYFIGGDNWCLSEKEYERVEKVNCESKNIKDDDQFSSTYVIEDNKCIEKLCIKVSEDNKTCEKFKETELEAKVEEVCPDGTKNDDGVCRKKYWMSKEYSCELGEIEGRQCVINDSIEMDKYCEEDGYKLTEDNEKCEKVTYYVAIEK